VRITLRTGHTHSDHGPTHANGDYPDTGAMGTNASATMSRSK